MNQSEPAEKAARLIQQMKLSNWHCDDQNCPKCIPAMKSVVERAIAESQVPQPICCPFCRSTRIQKLTSGHRCEECECQWSWGDGEPSPPSKITLENCQPENREFNDAWQLVSANRICWTGKPYARPGEALITANVGAWYETACWWREQAEKLGYSESGAAQEVSPPSPTISHGPPHNSDGEAGSCTRCGSIHRGVVKNRDTEGGKEFWDHVEKVAASVKLITQEDVAERSSRKAAKEICDAGYCGPYDFVEKVVQVAIDTETKPLHTQIEKSGDTRELKAALRKLVNETKGFVGMADVYRHGWTNVTVINKRIAEAERLLGEPT